MENSKYPLAISFGRAMKFRELGIFQHTEYAYHLNDKEEAIHHISEFGVGVEKSNIVKAASLIDMVPFISFIKNNNWKTSEQTIKNHKDQSLELLMFNCNFIFDCIMDMLDEKFIDINEIKLILAKEAQEQSQTT